MPPQKTLYCRTPNAASVSYRFRNYLHFTLPECRYSRLFCLLLANIRRLGDARPRLTTSLFKNASVSAGLRLVASVPVAAMRPLNSIDVTTAV